MASKVDVTTGSGAFPPNRIRSAESPERLFGEEGVAVQHLFRCGVIRWLRSTMPAAKSAIRNRLTKANLKKRMTMAISESTTQQLKSEKLKTHRLTVGYGASLPAPRSGAAPIGFTAGRAMTFSPQVKSPRHTASRI
jgi:hypothetical protein